MEFELSPRVTLNSYAIILECVTIGECVKRKLYICLTSAKSDNSKCHDTQYSPVLHVDIRNDNVAFLYHLSSPKVPIEKMGRPVKQGDRLWL